MRYLWFFLLLSSYVDISFAADFKACSCPESLSLYKDNFEVAYNNAAVIFSGIVEDVIKINPHDYIARIKVLDEWKMSSYNAEAVARRNKQKSEGSVDAAKKDGSSNFWDHLIFAIETERLGGDADFSKLKDSVNIEGLIDKTGKVIAGLTQDDQVNNNSSSSVRGGYYNKNIADRFNDGYIYVISTDNPLDCGMSLHIGGSYLIYADYRAERVLQVTRCGRTLFLEEAEDDLVRLAAKRNLISANHKKNAADNSIPAILDQKE